MYKDIITFWKAYLESTFTPSEARVVTEPWEGHRGYLLSVFTTMKDGLAVEVRFNTNKTLSIVDENEKLLKTLDHFESIDSWMKEYTTL